jgi:transcriptional regulator with XRE-family HTH domain
MPLRLATNNLPDVRAAVESERKIFAAKLRAARAILGWSQGKLAERAGLTQRAVHKLEQGQTEPRRATVHAIEQVWREQGLEFESVAEGGFRMIVSDAVLNRQKTPQRPSLRYDAGVTAQHHRSAVHR